MELRTHVCIDLPETPVARDLRFVASTLKIIPELDGIGDHCSNIACAHKRLNPPAFDPAGDLHERLGQSCRAMVKQSLALQ